MIVVPIGMQRWGGRRRLNGCLGGLVRMGHVMVRNMRMWVIVMLFRVRRLAGWEVLAVLGR